jgi:hypothetical protein
VTDMGYELSYHVISIRHFERGPMQIAAEFGIARNPDATGIHRSSWASLVRTALAPSPKFRAPLGRLPAEGTEGASGRTRW